jgi:predicted DNA-binding transcriptional regulator YafY
MSKVANMLNMVQILRDGKLHSINELAEKLEVSNRMIRVYKSELEQAGIYINGKKGVCGGYILEKELNKIDIGLTSNEIELLYKIKEHELPNKASIKTDNYFNILDKIISAYKNNIKNIDNIKLDIIKNKYNELSTIYKDFRSAINNKNKIFIEYNSINSGNTERIIHPAELFYYLDEWYIASFCELRKEIRLFELNNVIRYKILDEKYDKDFEIKR